MNKYKQVVIADRFYYVSQEDYDKLNKIVGINGYVATVNLMQYGFPKKAEDDGYYSLGYFKVNGGHIAALEVDAPQLVPTELVTATETSSN